MKPLMTSSRGDSPLVIDVPHAGTLLPAELQVRMTGEARSVPDTDWHVEKLYAFAAAEGATLLCATHSRYVVDLNRDPTGAALYPGADNTELCPTRTFAGAPIYRAGDEPSVAEIATRRMLAFEPYHVRLAQEIQRVRLRHGFAVVLDGHSIAGEVPRFFAGTLPDLNLGTADGASCAPSLEWHVARLLADAAGFTHIVNGRFKGGWITRHHGQPQHGVHALQLEIAQRCYMDEAPPWPFDEQRARRLRGVLQRLVAALIAWRPAA